MTKFISNLYKSLFSHRKGFECVPCILTKDSLPSEVANVIRSAYFLFCNALNEHSRNIYGKTITQKDIEKELWWRFRAQPLECFEEYGRYNLSFDPLMSDSSLPWNKKLDMVEIVIRWSRKHMANDNALSVILSNFVTLLNQEFERLNFGYRVVNDLIVDITSEEERQCIEDAINVSRDNVRQHLSKAIENYSLKPNADVSGSIKESISAVEALCREYTGMTGDNGTLGKALNKLEASGIPLHRSLKTAFEQLYTYTNSATTGIRHALMDSDGIYTPTKAEAYFMLIQCTAFINYLRMKMGK